MAALRILLLLLASASSPAVRGAAVPAKAADHVDVHIVGGRDALHGEFPHHVSVQAVPPGWLWYEGDPVHFCGGTLVTARWVLTAAQCTELPWGTKRVEVAVGISDLDLDHALPSGSQRIVVTKMISHEDYDHSYNLGIVPNDIALLKLADLVQLSSTVKLALLPSPGAIPTGDAVLAGWGSTSTDGNFPRYPDKLQMATFPIVDFQTCYDFVAELASSEPVNTLADTNICTGPLDMAGLAFCKGDSGSALIQGKGDETVVIGIVSWGAEHCGAKPRPSVYTRTSAFINWIETTQKNN